MHLFFKVPITPKNVRAIKPWITKELKELIGERDYAFKVAKRSGNEQGK